MQDPLRSGESAVEAYLPSQKVGIAVAVTYEPEASDATTGSYADLPLGAFDDQPVDLASTANARAHGFPDGRVGSADQHWRQIGVAVVRDDPPPTK